MSSPYDVIIIGAGMSGLAAGIRLAMFDQKVLILERHSIVGGLNSFYARKGRKLDVGLHAMTNFARPGEKNKPLLKICKQLRLSYEDLQLAPQSFSRICFPDRELQFSNQVELLRSNIAEQFPLELEAFDGFLSDLKNYDETRLDRSYQSAREALGKYFQDEALVERLLCPALIYGSAWERDMDFSQFAIMFKALFLEGFSRPKGGVRTILKLLSDRFSELGGEIRFRSGVSQIVPGKSHGEFVQVLLDSGEKLECQKLLSSAGLPETYRLINSANGPLSERTLPLAGQMSFTETILYFSKKPSDFGHAETINFFNNRPTYHYFRPQGELFDGESAVVCLPNNFQTDELADEGIVRITFIANYEEWKKLSAEEYAEGKSKVLSAALDMVQNIYPEFFKNSVLNFSDVFTPLTIERFTGHLNGCVYGSEEKRRDGRTDFSNIYVCGTDQGFLGIVGAMLSGISMANLHCLQSPAPTPEVRP
jgi:phytoene dehydrogenase-like protein